MRRSEKIEWFLRIVVFGAALVVGVVGSWAMWVSTRDYRALLLFVLAFVAVFGSMIYLIKRKGLRMLQT